MPILDHIGLGVPDMEEFVRLLTVLGICEIQEDNSPCSYKMMFSCGGILQLHKAECPSDVKLAIEIENLEAFTKILDDQSIVWTTRRGRIGVVDFSLCGIKLHTVPKTEIHNLPATHTPVNVNCIPYCPDVLVDRPTRRGTSSLPMSDNLGEHNPKVITGRVRHRDFRQWDPKQMVEFEFESNKYRVHKDAAWKDMLQLPDGRVIQVTWSGTDNLKINVIRVVNYPLANTVSE